MFCVCLFSARANSFAEEPRKRWPFPVRVLGFLLMPYDKNRNKNPAGPLKCWPR